MPVELRKRKAPPPAPEPPKKKAAKVVAKVKEAIKGKTGEPAKAEAPTKTNGAASKKVAVGDSIDLATYGGEVTLNDGTTTTLASLVEKSGSGVVLFTYPKASTPGCTNQACLFRDSYEPLTAGGLAIYGLSRDSPKSNTTFKEKQKLPYPLLCDPKASLISAIGLGKGPSSTQRGVFVVNKAGKVLLAEPGSPAGTVQAVKKLVESGVVNGAAPEVEKEKKEEEKTNGDAVEEAKVEESEEKKKKEEKEEK
ncbi:AhpC-TSA-domain-containing protein [Cryphonectria parasitica EP155]|uniref:thioredoxin-dependent peroxiredoxin n=1 Tax=Cryphonectria parasitica (strain ATCC 38755 / EP155) TaxID=660469 RepID=A0A9P4XSR8_CRYP1|nr:AhpC-TSA-domain-containing protein [Cryphonectria parasitica EP155]KAF3760659.1 AhpC-TSA-domain-containing protein [Cryphonectria parasitica EP155]